MSSRYDHDEKIEFEFLLKTIGLELQRWMKLRGSVRRVVAEVVHIDEVRLDRILAGEEESVTLEEISDIAFQLGLEIKANIMKV